MFLSDPDHRGAFASRRREVWSPNASRPRRRRPPVEFLEDRTLLSAATVGLISENSSGTNSALVGAVYPSMSADGRYVAFQSSSFQGVTTPAPSDLVNGLTVEYNAPNIYVRDVVTNTTICLSVDYQTGTTGNDDSRYPIISADGSTVVFLSNATDLTANDNPGNNPNSDQNVFAWSRATNTVSLVTMNYENTGPANDPYPQQDGTAANISVSADGRYVAYESAATDLVSGVTNNNYTTNIYVRDLQTNTTILVSRDVAGNNIGNGPSENPVISSDGSTVAFDSLANNLDPNYTGLASFSNYQVYATILNSSADTVSTTQLVSIDPTGTTAGNGGSGFSSLSDNGQMVAFQSAATNLVSISVQGGLIQDDYVRNLATNTTQLVSINQTGIADGDSSSFTPQISGDGDHVLFYSLASDLVASGNASSGNVFERNLTTNSTQLVSINDEGTNSGNATSHLGYQAPTNASQQATGQISDNGQYVIFASIATDLVPGFVQSNYGYPSGYDVYLRDTVGETTTLLSHAAGLAATGGTGVSGVASIAPDGQYVVFQSAFLNGHDNLVSNDTNASTQIFEAHLSVAAIATTQSATLIKTTGASLHASVSPEGSATTVTFVYGTNASLTSGTTTTSMQSIGAGTTAVPVTAVLTGLTPDATYYFEVEASNTGGISTGSILSFVATSTSTAPIASTQAATAILSTSATLNATVNPEGSATAVTFVYGTNPSLTSGTTTTSAQSTGAGTTAVSLTAALAGLTSGTTYYFEAKASNGGASATGSILSFTTTATGTALVAATQAATAITSAGATLNASVNPGGSSTSVTFVYGTSPSLTSGTMTTSTQSIGAGTAAVPVTAALTGLTSGTTYYFEAKASNSGGSATGSILSFTTTATGSALVAATQAATAITSAGGTLNASVNPGGSATSVTFVYGTNPSLTSGTTTTSAQSIGAGTAAVPLTAALTGLTSGTTYYFEVKASNGAGTASGSILSFATTATGTASVVTTQAATGIASTVATLHASVNPEGNATTVTFVYGTNASLTSGNTTTGAQSIGAGTTAVSVTAVLTGLTSGTTYYFEAKANNGGGTTTGSILSFATTTSGTAPVVTTLAASAITSTVATVNASVNPEGHATSVTFVYGMNPSLTSGTTTTSSQSIGAGTTAVSVTAVLTGLTSGTTYYFEVKANNAGGTSTGSVLSFNTAANPAVLQFAGSQFTANITDGSALIVVTRAGNPTATVTVVLSSPGGHGVAGFQSTITFAPNATSATASIPLQNDRVPGEGDTAIPLSLSSASTGASLGAAVASLIIHDNNAYPAPIQVTSVSTPIVVIKVGKGKKAKSKRERVLQIHFSGNITSGVLNAGAYHVKSGKTKKAVTTYSKNVTLSSFSYDTSTFVLTIYPAISLNLALPEQLQITSSLLTDAYGRPLDGNHDGQPGGDLFATFGTKGIRIQ